MRCWRLRCQRDATSTTRATGRAGPCRWCADSRANCSRWRSRATSCAERSATISRFIGSQAGTELKSAEGWPAFSHRFKRAVDARHAGTSRRESGKRFVDYFRSARADARRARRAKRDVIRAIRSTAARFARPCRPNSIGSCRMGPLRNPVHCSLVCQNAVTQFPRRLQRPLLRASCHRPRGPSGTTSSCPTAAAPFRRWHRVGGRDRGAAGSPLRSAFRRSVPAAKPCVFVRSVMTAATASAESRT